MIDQIKDHIQQYFNNGEFSYHSLDHAFSVHDDAVRIAQYQERPEADIELLRIAALFHDTGYIKDPEHHEEIGVKIAQDYLEANGLDQDKMTQVANLIKATKLGAQPLTDLEGIIRDADLAHIGKQSFGTSSDLLRKERENIEGKKYTDKEWLENNISFLENHKWNSKGAKSLFKKGKKENLAKQKELLKKIKKEAEFKIPEKGIETMYRVALRNHNQLSKIADNKANIMLSITAIMLSLILSSLAPKIDSNQRLLIPTVIIILVNLVTMFFAILATIPKVSSAPYTREKFLDNKINLLFFGNFYKMPLQEFEWGMQELMKDRDLLYGSLSKDLYFLGSVLAKKYKFLQYAYAVFMGGLIISAIAFIWAFIVG